MKLAEAEGEWEWRTKKNCLRIRAQRSAQICYSALLIHFFLSSPIVYSRARITRHDVCFGILANFHRWIIQFQKSKQTWPK